VLYHEPVMLEEVLEALCLQPGETIVDGCHGSAGHSREMFARVLPGGRLVAMDRDPAMLAIGQKRMQDEFPMHASQMTFMAAPYERVAEAGVAVDAMLLDLGWNSLQLEDPSRGFSFSKDGPLDARYNSEDGSRPVSWYVNNADEKDLARWMLEYSDERLGRQIARRIVAERRAAPIESTLRLASLVSEVYPAKERYGRIHPATRVFQALRIVANDEIGAVERGIDAALSVLKPGGRLACLAFHSIEDRAVKRKFDQYASPRPTPEDPYRATSSEGLEFEIPTRRGLFASDEEADRNPRARSARLRVIRRKGAKP
jgi:16S rRNA (cytosine1402-N4)-methyltransferase